MLSPVIWFVEPKCTHSLLSHHNVYDGMSFSLSLKTNLAHVVCLIVWGDKCIFGAPVLQLQLCLLFFVACCSLSCQLQFVVYGRCCVGFRCNAVVSLCFLFQSSHTRTFFFLCGFMFSCLFRNTTKKKQEINCLVFCVLLLSVQHLKKKCKCKHCNKQITITTTAFK